MVEGHAQAHTTSKLNSGLSDSETQTLNRHAIGLTLATSSLLPSWVWGQWAIPSSGSQDPERPQELGFPWWTVTWTKLSSCLSLTADTVCVLNHRVSFILNRDEGIILGHQSWQRARALWSCWPSNWERPWEAPGPIAPTHDLHLYP